MRTLAVTALALASLVLQGCLARAAVDVVTLPVRAVSKGVDLATTSQSEADENRGREIRKREERLGKLERDLEKQMERCADGNDEACDEAQAIRAEMKALIPGIPVEPDRGD
jgi:outer membrane murein-binding lipoprotein Lpp